jgi:hypothetical protein
VADLGFDPTQSDVLDMGVDGSWIYMSFGAPTTAVALDLDHDSLVKATTKANIGDPRTVSDGAIVALAGAGIALMRPDGSVTPLITPAGQKVIGALGVDRAAGQQIAWVEANASGSGCSNAVLWTTPYATSASGVTRRAVAVANDMLGRCGAGLVVNAGVVLTLIDLDKAQVTRLSDGMGWVISAEAGDVFSQPLWVDDNDVWLSTGPASDTSGGVSDYTGIFRIARAGLGSPTVPSGL